MEANFTDLMVLEIPSDAEMLEPFVARVLVGGTKDLPYVQQFTARFNDEPVEAIAIDMQGTGFTGYLRNLPDGDAKLFVEFPGDDPIDTGITFSSAVQPDAPDA
jgi:hypothetical protein